MLVSDALWFTLLKVVQHIARGSTLLEKLMFYSIKFHFASAKKRLSQSNMPPFVMSMYSVQTCRPRCFLTQLDHSTGNVLHTGGDIWNHRRPPNQEIAAADHFEIKGCSCFFIFYQINQNKNISLVWKLCVWSLDFFFFPFGHFKSELMFSESTKLISAAHTSNIKSILICNYQ